MNFAERAEQLEQKRVVALAEIAEQLEQALAAARADHATSQAGRDGIPFELMRDTTGRYIAIEALTTLAMVRLALDAQDGRR